LDCIEKLFNLSLTPLQKKSIQRKDEQGHSDRIQFCNWLKSFLDLSFDEDEIWRIVKSNIGKFVQLNKNVKELLGQLQKEYTLVLLTNGGTENQQLKINHTGLNDFFSSDKILISASIGFSKPDPEAFQMVEKLFHQKTQFYMIGDHWEKDILGAKNKGWKAIYLNADSKHSEMENVKIISSLLELKPALNELRY